MGSMPPIVPPNADFFTVLLLLCSDCFLAFFFWSIDSTSGLHFFESSRCVPLCERICPKAHIVWCIYCLAVHVVEMSLFRRVRTAHPIVRACWVKPFDCLKIGCAHCRSWPPDTLRRAALFVTFLWSNSAIGTFCAGCCLSGPSIVLKGSWCVGSAVCCCKLCVC
jgi:hypothetical protein